jgi:hypothetical protein
MGLTALAAAVTLWAVRGNGAPADSTLALLAGAVGGALLLIAWLGLVLAYIDSFTVKPRIVPYFRSSVPGPDTFFGGASLARHCRALDRIAAQAGVAGLSAFGFADECRGEATHWSGAAEGLATFRALIQRLEAEPALLSETEPVLAELRRVEEKLREAERLQVEFCLHLRADAAYTGHEFDSRKGRYW